MLLPGLISRSNYLISLQNSRPLAIGSCKQKEALSSTLRVKNHGWDDSLLSSPCGKSRGTGNDLRKAGNHRNQRLQGSLCKPTSFFSCYRSILSMFQETWLQAASRATSSLIHSQRKRKPSELVWVIPEKSGQSLLVHHFPLGAEGRRPGCGW